MAGDSLLFGDCRSVTHLESGEQIWADDDVHSLLVTLLFVFLFWTNMRSFVDQANCNEIELDLEDESNRTYLGKNTPMEEQ